MKLIRKFSFDEILHSKTEKEQDFVLVVKHYI